MYPCLFLLLLSQDTIFLFFTLILMTRFAITHSWPLSRVTKNPQNQHNDMGYAAPKIYLVVKLDAPLLFLPLMKKISSLNKEIFLEAFMYKCYYEKLIIPNVSFNFGVYTIFVEITLAFQSPNPNAGDSSALPYAIVSFLRIVRPSRQSILESTTPSMVFSVTCIIVSLTIF
jgi:hypothetical protein